MHEYCYSFPVGIELKMILDLAQKCEHDVFFESTEGDCLALKSTLGQFIFFSLVRNPEFLPENAHIRCLGEHDSLIFSSIMPPCSK